MISIYFTDKTTDRYVSKCQKWHLILLIVLLPMFFFGQNLNEEKGDKNYNALAYVDAIRIYENNILEGSNSVELYKNLGNAYYFNADLAKASSAYSELHRLQENLEPEILFRYSHALKSVGNYTKADEMMTLFNRSMENDKRASIFRSNKDYMSRIKEQSGRYTIESFSLNSSTSDFAPSFYDHDLVFSSARDTGLIAKTIHKWDESMFNDLYLVPNDKEGDANGETYKISKKINSKYEESTTSFTNDGRTVYFTRSNFVKGKLSKDGDGVVRLKILRATLNKKDKWDNVEELPFNNNNYSVAHPALSTDNTKLYFSSDMPGSYGMSDVYVVDILPDGTFGEPQNLGEQINTPGRETFPFISKNGDFYFASDAYLGLGGLDVFVAKLESHNKVGAIYNIGEPINSRFDDFSFIIDDDSSKGYFASNREGGLGSDDIYAFVQEKPLVVKEIIAGTVIDAKTRELIENAEVFVLLDNNIVKQVKTNDQGHFSFGGLNNTELFNIKAAKKAYVESMPQLLVDMEKPITIYLNREAQIVNSEDNLPKKLQINPIYFDLDKWYIRQDAKTELNKVLTYLKEHPTVHIIIESHTDSRASKEYNKNLSENRAKATLEYLVSKGISRDRLQAKGYGESRLKNHCEDGVDCSKEEHQLNRRSEFIINSTHSK